MFTGSISSSLQQAKMDEVNLVLPTIGRFVNTCGLLLDLLIGTFGWLICFLSSTLSAPCGPTLAEYWNFALFSFLTTTEAVSTVGYGALHAVESWLQSLGGAFEIFKMVGHLLCHVAWHLKDLLHRGLISGGCVLRQTWEGLCIVLSLVLYFINTVVNLVLISTQNCLHAVAGVWEMVADPVHTMLELALTLLTFLYSCVVGASMLLWMPCQLILDLVEGLGHVFFTVFEMDICSLCVTAASVLLILLLVKHGLPVLAARLHRTRSVQTTLDYGLSREEVHTRTAQVHGDPPITETGPSAAGESSPVREVIESAKLPANKGRTSRPKSELLSLLKEQEERKRCVICQDLSKTVLLLPCRHLCLCRHCADILSRRRHVQQRCCPLCRQPITQTMDVFL